MTEIIISIVSLPALVVWLILFLSAGIEYVLPPFPGDMIVLGGGVLAGSQGLNFLPVFLAVTLGSVAGAALDYQFGVWLARPGEGRLHRWAARPWVASGLRQVRRGFQKHGDLYLILNRFLPGIRAFFFIAAGLAGLSRRRTLLLATGAALLWNALLLAVGLVIGAHIDRLIQFARTYSSIAWLVVAVAILFLLVRLFWRQRKNRA